MTLTHLSAALDALTLAVPAGIAGAVALLLSLRGAR